MASSGKQPAQSLVAIGAAASPTNASGTYVDLTDMTVTITPRSSVLLARLVGGFQHSTAGQNVTVALSLGGAAEVGAMAGSGFVANQPFCLSTFARFTGVTIGAAITLKGRWLTTAGTATAAGVQRYLVVEESS